MTATTTRVPRELQDLTQHPVDHALAPNQPDASETFIQQMADSILLMTSVVDEPGLEFCAFKLVDDQCRTAHWQLTKGVPNRIQALLSTLRGIRAQAADEIRENKMERVIVQLRQQEGYIPFWEARLEAAKRAYSTVLKSLDNGEPGNYYAYIGHEWRGDVRDAPAGVRRLTEADREAADFEKRYGGKTAAPAQRQAEHSAAMDEIEAQRGYD